MAKYRKRPVVVEAVVVEEPMVIETLEGTMKGSAGDYLITGVAGEKYFCKPDIFLATYEAVEEGSEKGKVVEDGSLTPSFTSRLEIGPTSQPPPVRAQLSNDIKELQLEVAE